MKRVITLIMVMCMATQLSAKDIVIRKAADDSLYFFAKHILGYTLLAEAPHADMCAFYERTGVDKLGLEPRDHFKSTIVSVSKAIWLTTKYPNIKILVNHKTLKRAKMLLREIKGHYEANDTFKYYYGDYVGEKWTEDEIIIAPRVNRAIKEATVTVGGVDYEITGGHFNYIVNDDLVGMKDMVSEAERERTLRYVKGEKFLRDKGFFLGIDTIGTRWNIDDVYAWMMDNQTLDMRIRKAYNDDGTPYFPSRYTVEELTRMEKEDPLMFSSQMLNEPLPSDTQIYKHSDFSFYEHNADFVNNILSSAVIYAYADLALGKSTHSDYTAIIVGAKHNGLIYPFDAFIDRVRPSVAKGQIISFCRKYNIRRFGIESNAFQELFVDDMKAELRRAGISTEIVPVMHTSDKVLRISSAHGTIVGNVRFREDCEDVYPLLLRQLIEFPQGAHDDAPDALEGLVSMFEGIKEFSMRFVEA